MLCTLIIPILIQCIREKKNSAGLYALIHNVCLVIGMFGGLKGLMHRKKNTWSVASFDELAEKYTL